MNGIDEYIWRPIKDGQFRASIVDVFGTTAPFENFTVIRLMNEVKDKRCIH